jgi:hypothetical protein
MIAGALESIKELPLSEVPFGQLIATDDDGTLQWGFRALFEKHAGVFWAGLKNTEAGDGASCIVSEDANARVLMFDRYVLEPDFSQWVSVAAVPNIELMHTALVLDTGALKLVVYVRNSGRIRTDAFLLDIKSGVLTMANLNQDVTTFSGFRIGLPGRAESIEWVFRTHRSEQT